ncbi:MAG: DUF2007 domain-containing protein [Gemmatimonadetes bacterium]|nr:DUF2007 domain-containing protein [Gemmatimonadota bacterium]MBI2403105.1 DUF2007 domain-containing protein [Gemmatimonadota bacterium]MBI2535545.1 DUF2007 domain-containing protein [Gemmatimonadota bacterium]MBI2614954.1 DUF2007 domain-containing protein [Gemmatimonadota bacterium]
MTDLVSVRSFRTRAEAELAENTLAAAGIRAVVMADDAGGAHPELAFTTGGSRVLVAPEDAARARELLSAQPAR